MPKDGNLKAYLGVLCQCLFSLTVKKWLCSDNFCVSNALVLHWAPMRRVHQRHLYSFPRCLYTTTTFTLPILHPKPSLLQAEQPQSLSLSSHDRCFRPCNYHCGPAQDLLQFVHTFLWFSLQPVFSPSHYPVT